jgi:hypothetical protein
MELEDWEKELRNEYGSPEVKAEPTPSAQSAPVPVQEPKVEIKPVEDKPVEIKPVEDTPKDSGTWLFLILFLILGITIVWIYDDKTGGKIKSSIMSTFHSKENVKPEEKELISDAEVAKLKTELEKFRSENKTVIDAIQAKLNSNSSKIGLMGLLLNENFTMIMNGKDASDFVFFNRDWTLDRMPKYIEMTEDDKEYLKKFIRTNQ